MAKVLLLNGNDINWSKPPKPTDMVMWSKKTTSGKVIKGSFRAICHWNRLNDQAKRRFGVEIDVIQACFNTGVAASKGTHDLDLVGDFWIPGVDPWVQQRFFRANGFACWYRHPPLFGNHVHGFTLPVAEGKLHSDDFAVAGFKVGIYVDGGYSTEGHLVTSSQIEDYYNHAFGLKDQHTPGSDRSWFPPDIPATAFNLDAYVAHQKKLQTPSQTFFFNVGTTNIMALPLMSQSFVNDDFDTSYALSRLTGYQEIHPERYQLANRQHAAEQKRIIIDDASRPSSPIVFASAVWESLDSGTVLLHPTTRNICGERNITWTHLRHRKSGVELVNNNVHYVADAWNDDPQTADTRALRQKMWNAGNRVHRDLIASWVDQGLAVVGEGDYNRKAYPVVGKNYGIRMVSYFVNGGIDYIWAIDSKEVKFLLADSGKQELHSDHQAHWARLNMTVIN